MPGAHSLGLNEVILRSSATPVLDETVCGGWGLLTLR